MCIVLGVMFSPAARLYMRIAVLGLGMAVAAACLGFSLWGGWAAVAGAVLAGLYVGGVMVFHRRRTAASLLAAGAQGEEAGLADAVVVGIAVYEAAVFPLTPGGVSEAERKARRTVAYQLAAHEALPNAVRVAAAAALEAIDAGRDRDRARAAVTALALTAYDRRAAHTTRRARPPGGAEHDPLTGP
ncbi:hypothetical protein [Streptomyces sp. SCL15-6]|uniref:hypothetical protein n=1 Tax=Streptomyces sp. SCL15-6 TaxID=2967222 RepID=UPI002966DA39|nr:hypothetical protein [Streptomyces sp. SCL15-6]